MTTKKTLKMKTPKQLLAELPVPKELPRPSLPKQSYDLAKKSGKINVFPSVKTMGGVSLMPSVSLREVFDPPVTFDEVRAKTDQIFFGAQPPTLFDATVADIYDATIGVIPLVGDIIELPRISSAMREVEVKKDRSPKVALYAVDTVVGIVPVFGDIVDALLPANVVAFVGDRLADMPRGIISGVGNTEILPPIEDVARGDIMPKSVEATFASLTGGKTLPFSRGGQSLKKGRKSITMVDVLKDIPSPDDVAANLTGKKTKSGKAFMYLNGKPPMKFVQDSVTSFEKEMNSVSKMISMGDGMIPAHTNLFKGNKKRGGMKNMNRLPKPEEMANTAVDIALLPITIGKNIVDDMSKGLTGKTPMLPTLGSPMRQTRER